MTEYIKKRYFITPVLQNKQLGLRIHGWNGRQTELWRYRWSRSKQKLRMGRMGWRLLTPKSIDYMVRYIPENRSLQIDPNRKSVVMFAYPRGKLKPRSSSTRKQAHIYIYIYVYFVFKHCWSWPFPIGKNQSPTSVMAHFQSDPRCWSPHICFCWIGEYLREKNTIVKLEELQ